MIGLYFLLLMGFQDYDTITLVIKFVTCAFESRVTGRHLMYFNMAMRHELADFALQSIFRSILHPLRLIQS